MSMESFSVFRELAFSKHILLNRYKMMMMLMSISIAHGFIDLNAQCVEGNFIKEKLNGKSWQDTEKFWCTVSTIVTEKKSQSKIK